MTTRVRLRSTSPRQARKSPATLPSVENVIHVVRGERVILDADLARLYGVETRVLNQAVRRNRDKFPPDFMFELTRDELRKLQTLVIQEDTNLRSQSVTSSRRHGGRRYAPCVFTEHGALMAANVLNSPQAVQMSVFVIRAFVKMRSLLTDTRELARKLASLEKELTGRLDSHEVAIAEFMRRIMILLDPPPVGHPRHDPLRFAPGPRLAA